MAHAGEYHGRIYAGGTVWRFHLFVFYYVLDVCTKCTEGRITVNYNFRVYKQNSDTL
jgi:hypothetical protein